MEQEKYMVAFIYPRVEGEQFDIDHYINVHLPLGVGLTNKHLNIKPSKITVYTSIEGTPDNLVSREYTTVCNLFFDSKKDADKFLKLLDVPEAAERLSADYPNYTAKPPQAIWAKVIELQDIDTLIERFQKELENS